MNSSQNLRERPRATHLSRRNPNCAALLLAAALLFPQGNLSAEGTPGSDAETFVDSTAVDAVFRFDGQIYWKKGCQAANPTLVAHKPAGGLSSSIVFQAPNCTNDSPFSDLGYDGTFVYWVTDDGRVIRKSWGAPGSPINLVSTTVDISSMREPPKCAVTDRYVYWHESTGEFSEGAKIYRQRRDGSGTRSEEFDFGSHALKQMFLRDDNHIIYLEGPEGDFSLRVAERRPVIDGFVWFSTFVARPVQGFAVGGSRLYFSRIVGGNIEIRSVSLADPDGAETTHHTISGGVQPVVAKLTASDDYLFWHEVRAGVGPLQRMRLSNNAVDSVVLDIPDTATFTNDGYHVYWNQSRSRICRVPVEAAPAVRDLEARGLEIVQTIQNAANDVPLVRNKETFVRLYARIRTASPGITSVAGWPMAILHGELPDGTPLPGSPLTHQSGRAAIYTRDHRREDGEGFIFRLPDSWPQQEQIVLRGEVNPGRVLTEPDYNNNTIEETAAFQPKSPICVHVLPCDIRDRIRGGSYEPWMQPIFDRAEALLPTSDLRVYFPGGTPIRELQVVFPFPPIFELGTFEFSEDNDDSWKMLVELSLRFPFTSVPQDCWDSNARNHYCIMAPGFSNRPKNGVAYGRQVLLFSTTMDSEFDFNSAIGGVTFAHELGHNYRRDHVNCPTSGDDAPSGTDDDYPYDSCNLGPATNEFLGYDPISRSLIRFDEAGDLMSYAHLQQPRRPRWPSDYTYRGILSELNNTPSASPGRGPRGITPLARRLVVGGYDPDNANQFEIWHTYRVSGEALVAANSLYNSEGNSKSHELRSYDADGKLVETVAALFPDTHESINNSFIGLMADDPDVRRIDLVPSAPPRGTLASVGGGASPPTVTILRPATAEVVTDQLTVEWSGKDLDRGDYLRYLVRYSHDAGTTWRTLAANTPFESLAVTTDGLPGGNRCQVEVIASDGLLNGSARSGFFQVAPKTPQPHIFFIGNRGGDCVGADTFFASSGESIILRGVAYDDEDGPLDGNRLTWSVQGAAQLAGFGEEIGLRDLRSGTYPITLTAVDEDQGQGTTTATLIVDPKFVEEAGASPALQLDGRIDDNAYLVRDDYPLTLRYGDGQLSMVRMVHDDGALYVAAAGLPAQTPGVLFPEYFAIQFDTDNGDSARPQADDVQYRIYAADGRIETYRGNGSFFVADTIPDAAVRASVYHSGGFWNAELCIAESALGGWSGQQVGMRLVHANSTVEGENAAWPSASHVWDSASWGDIILAPHPSAPFDGDGDGMADQWERDNLGGTTAHDGSGNRDGDTLTDYQEYVFGSDPNDPTSQLTVEPRSTEAGVTLSWPSVAYRAYTIYRSTDLQSWEAVVRLEDASPPRNNFLDPNPPATRAYYIIEGHVCR